VDAAESESGQTELEFYGYISEYSWYEDDITPAIFKEELYAKGKGGPVLMKINSPGGDVIAASVMRAILSDYPGEVTARVDGIAASAAVGVTIAARRVVIMDAAYMMIHDPSIVVFMAMLDIETLGRLRTELLNVKDGIIMAYQKKTGLTDIKLSRMMTEETWMSARQAVEYGFADEILAGGQNGGKKGGIDNLAFVNCLQTYANTPPEVLQAYQFMNIPEAMDSSEPLLTEDMQREAQDLRFRVHKILERS
jgi:ATP-dependent Clp protease protease subunit